VNHRAILASGSIAIFAITQLFGHGWSEEMRRELSAPAPEWLAIGTTIKAEPTKQKADDQKSFRPISGDSQSTRDRVSIPSRGIEIKVDYPISWYRGSSLSPDGTKLIINSGADTKLYEIHANGQHRQIELKLPRVTYDEGPKGFITGWSWADNTTLLGEAEVDNEKGEFIEKRVYVFHLRDSTLSRLDVSALNLATTEGLTVTKVGTDLGSLRLSIGDAEFTVSADLKSPPHLSEQQQQGADPSTTPPSVMPPAPKNATSTKRLTSTPTKEPASSTMWSIIVVLIVTVIGLLWLVLKKRK
jgi:hypothetical protein